jgi:hypothetical protein
VAARRAGAAEAARGGRRSTGTGASRFNHHDNSFTAQRWTRRRPAGAPTRGTRMTVPCQDARAGPVTPRTAEALAADLPADVRAGRLHLDHYRGLMLGVGLVVVGPLYGSHVTGYVLAEALDPKTGAPLPTKALLAAIGADAVPHGGFTARLGFDCAHAGDRRAVYADGTHRGGSAVPADDFLWRHHGAPAAATHKTWRFALAELRRLGDALLAAHAAGRLRLAPPRF